MSDRIVGLTVVAVGTSLPELVTSIVAARRGHSDLAIGNVVGSNIFNALLCLGVAGLARTVDAPLSMVALDLVVLAALTLLAVLFLRNARTVTRTEGAVLLGAYLVFIAWSLLRGAG
jgi:cation:H+ antiporter